jgi:hypothetical protein
MMRRHQPTGHDTGGGDGAGAGRPLSDEEIRVLARAIRDAVRRGTTGGTTSARCTTNCRERTRTGAASRSSETATPTDLVAADTSAVPRRRLSPGGVILRNLWRCTWWSEFEVRVQKRATEARISSAVLVQTKGRASAFAAATYFRIARSSV